MSSGRDHDQQTKLWRIPFGLAISIVLGLQNGIISSLAFWIGGIFLSPDLDTNSLCLKRWGIFGIIWSPYRKLIPHRSLLSHGPFIGTLLRLVYLITITYLIYNLIIHIGITSIEISEQTINNFLTTNQVHLYAIFLGIEGSAWLHIIQDGDPLPIELKKIRRFWKKRSKKQNE